MFNKREFTELLKGCAPVKDRDGKIIVQSILNMQIVCLTTSDEFSLDDKFAHPLKALLASNSTYGEISFSNKEKKDVIVPTQIAVMTKQRAQNHGMVKAGYVSASSRKTYHDAGCVEGSTPGYFNNTSEFRFIPLSMREMLYNKVGETGGYQNIYPAINRLGDQTRSSAGNYLDVYFKKYDRKLEEFIAHFERPKKFIGTIVLIDGEIVAIDKFPSFTYAEQVWDLLIRDCYGSLAIISEIGGYQQKNAFTDAFNKLVNKSRNADVLDLMETALKNTKKEITDNVVEKIEQMFDLTFDVKSDNDDRERSFILESEGYLGQVISESGFNYLVSIVKKESFNPTAMKAVGELKRKARRQDRFSL
jgi:hypothetical protein